MRDDYNNGGGFVKPDAESYKRSKQNKGNNTGKDKDKYSSKTYKSKNEQKVAANRDFIHRDKNVNSELSKEEKKQNIIFVVSVVSFLIVLIIAKASYKNMQQSEMNKLSKTKWFVSNDKDMEKVGYLEIEFGSNGTFDMYKADTQVSCMNGKYEVKLGGRLKLKSDEKGFNPPGEWKCKKNSTFKYKYESGKLILTYKGVDVTFEKLGESNDDNLENNTELLNKKYFVNKQAKMLVTFYMSNMYMYKIDDLENVFGTSGEVVGEICFSGKYELEPEKSKIALEVVEEDYEITSNPMWEDMTEYKEYEFLYKLEKDYSKIVLQRNDKAYEFEKYVIGE